MAKNHLIRAGVGRLIRFVATLSLLHTSSYGGNAQSSDLPDNALREKTPIGLNSDLDNDGQITDHDTALKQRSYAPDATDEDRQLAAEYLLVNNRFSNGLWDREDPEARAQASNIAEDDDVERIEVSCDLHEGLLWFAHKAIDQLEFFTNKRCDPSDRLTFPVVLSQTPIGRKTLFIRTTGAFASEVDDDLALRTGPDQTHVLFEDKIRLNIVHAVGDPGQHFAMVNYIKENNTRYYTDRPLPPPFLSSFQFTVFLKDRIGLSGINASADGLQTIYDVAKSPKWNNQTLIVNISYGNGIINSHGFYDKHYGKLFHDGAWDASCSLPYTGPPNIFGYGNPATYIAMSKTGDITFGPFDPPNDTLEGSGGLMDNGGYPGPLSCFGWVDVGADRLIAIGMSSRTGRNPAAGQAFKGLFLANHVHGQLCFCDGYSSVALALKSPAGDLRVCMSPGESHDPIATAPSDFFQGIKNYFSRAKPPPSQHSIKTYLGIRAHKFRDD